MPTPPGTPPSKRCAAAHVPSGAGRWLRASRNIITTHSIQQQQQPAPFNAAVNEIIEAAKRNHHPPTPFAMSRETLEMRCAALAQEVARLSVAATAQPPPPSSDLATCGGCDEDGAADASAGASAKGRLTIKPLPNPMTTKLEPEKLEQ